jgi:hypothetical protein
MSRYNIGLGFNNAKQTDSINSVKTSKPKLGRVYDIILDDDHPDFELSGKVLGAIRYHLFNEDYFVDDKKFLSFAYPLDSTTRTYPLKNEIVILNPGPNDLTDRSDSDYKMYYSSVISVWNAASHNATMKGDAKQVPETDLGYNAKELENINILYPNHGDHIIEGRFGNSIRLGGYKGSKNTITNNDNEGKPYTIISNGREFTGDVRNPTYEDINKDNSSIYITSDHSIPIVEARSKNLSAVDKSINGKTYKGSQIILNSDRLFFNAKDNDILLSSKESIGASALNINLDGEDYISLDAKKIYLGHDAKDRDTGEKLPQPAVLGDQLEILLHDLLILIKNLGKELSKAKTVDGKFILNLNAFGKILENSTSKNLLPKVNPLKKNSTLKSKKVFIE